MSWIDTEALEADSNKDLVILEHPTAVHSLDGLLLNRFIPDIWRHLQATGYHFHPELPVISSVLSHALVRSVSFMLFDFLSFPFFQGSFSVQADSWMLDRTFNLGLPRTTNPDFLFRILSDNRFSGMPPTLEIQDSVVHPDWNIYYVITIHSGSGTSLGSPLIESNALKTVENVITVSQGLYNIAMADGFSTMADVKRFLDLAAIAFGAS